MCYRSASAGAMLSATVTSCWHPIRNFRLRHTRSCCTKLACLRLVRPDQRLLRRIACDRRTNAESVRLENRGVRRRKERPSKVVRRRGGGIKLVTLKFSHAYGFIAPPRGLGEENFPIHLLSESRFCRSAPKSIRISGNWFGDPIRASRSK